MSKTPFSNKCAILGELWCFYREEAATDDTWTDFFSWADVALPMAFTLWMDMTSIKRGEKGDEAKGFIDEAFDMLCEMLDVDRDGSYKDLSDFFAASPNAPMQTVKQMPESNLTVAVLDKNGLEDEG